MTRPRSRVAWTAFGLALGTAAILLGFIVAPRLGWSLAVVPLFGLPVIWAAGAVWWYRPQPHIRYGSGRPILLGSIGSAYAVTVLLVLAQVAEVMPRPSGQPPGWANPLLIPWTVVFFPCVGLPAGLICLLYLVGSGLLSFWLGTRDDKPGDES